MNQFITPFHSGFIALIGRPNVGKSTLVNQLIGKKITITSEKPQTTRNIIRGIYTNQNMQMVFLDTPGVHKPKYKLGEQMMRAVERAFLSCDIILYLVDGTKQFGLGEKYIISLLRNSNLKRPVFLIINKIDLLKKEQLLPLIEFYTQKFSFDEIIPLSALSGENKECLLQMIYQRLSEGPCFYPEDSKTDLTESMFIAELIREQVLKFTCDEIPYSVAVTISNFQEQNNGIIYISANIYVERDSQKGIIIGKNGNMLKKIGSSTRNEIEEILACNCFLELRVKIQKDWRNNSYLLNEWLKKE